MAHRICPFWVGYLLACPLRRLWHNPRRILRPYVRPNMKVVDVGCAMGYFTLPLARMVEPKGRVVAVDIQEKMLAALRRRARRARLERRISAHLCTVESLNLDEVAGAVDFVLAFAVLHEVAEPQKLYAQVGAALKPGGRFLLAEPVGRVTAAGFEGMVAQAQQAGFTLADRPRVARSRAVVLVNGK